MERLTVPVYFVIWRRFPTRMARHRDAVMPTTPSPIVTSEPTPCSS
jgi:hypothetical protein